MIREIVGFRRRVKQLMRPVSGTALRYPKFAVAIFALVALGFVGVAVDHSNAVHAKADLQEALDTAASEVVQKMDGKSDDEVKKTVEAIVEERLVPDQDLASLIVAVDRKSRRLRCRASVRVDATLTSLIGPPYQEVVAATDAVAEPVTVAAQ